MFICWFSCIWFYKYFVVIALAFIYWPRCQWWLRVKHFSDGRLSSFYFAEREKKQWRWKWKKTRTQNVSWLVEAFPLGHPLASIISHCFVFSALLRCNYLSHPCHIQGNTLRGFDILTATEDGHNLQRHSTQAGRQAGGDSKGKTVSWTTAVRNVSNQGQGEEGTGSGEREGQTQPVFLRGSFYKCWGYCTNRNRSATEYLPNCIKRG